jgi:hypothetical protein
VYDTPEADPHILNTLMGEDDPDPQHRAAGDQPLRGEDLP